MCHPQVRRVPGDCNAPVQHPDVPSIRLQLNLLLFTKVRRDSTPRKHNSSSGNARNICPVRCNRWSLSLSRAPRAWILPRFAVLCAFADHSLAIALSSENPDRETGPPPSHMRLKSPNAPCEAATWATTAGVPIELLFCLPRGCRSVHLLMMWNQGTALCHCTHVRKITRLRLAEDKVTGLVRVLVPILPPWSKARAPRK